MKKNNKIQKEIEKVWKVWEKEKNLYLADDKSKKPKKYILDMFPYPSGDGLHVGHVESYTATDIYARYLRMKGYNVLHPQGWDAFGLPAENFAVKTGIHPEITTKKAIRRFKEQMRLMGFSYDWTREINSSSPNYYKWTQWFFLLLYKNGLAYKKLAKVNWCPKCKTVLANEQAEGGRCERCESQVIQKELEQWFFKITDFIEDQYYKGRKIKGLLNGLDDVDWPSSTKEAQRNWIGKSEGAIVEFKIQDLKFKNKKIVEVFTTRPDTLFGATYLVLAPEHSIIKNIIKNKEFKIENKKEVIDYINKAKKKTNLERTDLAKEKTGIKLKGLVAINPVNKKKIPVFVADYVMIEYGTGAVMAVPAHDQRDYDFARKFKLPIIEVVKGGNIKKEAFEGDGININSGFLNGLETKKAKEKMIKWLEKNGLGKRAVNYKLKDWLISRQRYWGAPLPIVYDPKGNPHPIPEKYLPWKLPKDVKFEPKGYSPLSRSKELIQRTERIFGKGWRPEVDTMDTFVCSSWYYFRYVDPKNKKVFASQKAIKKWLPVDVYVGGAEHTVLHLLYARFFTKVLQKYDYIDFNEPFLKLRHQGIILAPDGQKMSKSKGNVTNPDDIVKEYGPDVLRMYEMFLGPLEDAKPWNTEGILGIKRFLDRVEKLKLRVKNKKIQNEKLEILINATIKKIEEDIENFKFNTAISALMILLNHFEKEKEISKRDYCNFLIILSPFAPFLSEKIWQELGNKKSIFREKWPKYKKNVIEKKTLVFLIQINGKLRDKVEVKKGISQKELEKLIMNREKVKKYILGKKIKKIIFVPNRLINIVV